MMMTINNNQPIAIIGGCNSGKSNLLVYLARLTNRKKYLLGYPKPISGFTLLSSVEDLRLISDCTLCIDELSAYFPPWERRTNDGLMRLFQFAHHNNIKVIFTTQLSQGITKQLEAFITQWAIKSIRVSTLKNGSTPKNIIKYSIKHPNVNADIVKLGVEEFIWFNEVGVAGENGIRSFPDQKVLKDWKQIMPSETATETATDNATGISTEQQKQL
jgi:hypothetical protein